ncbi:MAG: 4'-phosphopantetheinyl transferase superfamily protein, partial [Ruminococcus sp.]|nr:4'-phosphopantetheinyl transferase superfamily protein [Ruminococcus sp.]
SHSGTCVMIAVDDREIGADVEKLPEKDYLKIAERFYHPNEREYVKRAADPARAFTHIWTRKEAYLKQLGIGISTDLTAFDTMSGELSERLRTFDIDGYAISVCAEYSLNENAHISKLELNELMKRV